MKQNTILAAVFVFFFIVTNAYPVDSISSDKIKDMLLRPNGWSAEWKGNTYSGESEFIFEERGENVVVKILTPSFNLSCERDVKITSDVIKFDGCNDTGIQLQYDPNDKKYPFKGVSPNINYKLKEK
jgi:hypothetical protein